VKKKKQKVPTRIEIKSEEEFRTVAVKLIESAEKEIIIIGD
jgi:hypothetical protein